MIYLTFSLLIVLVILQIINYKEKKILVEKITALKMSNSFPTNEIKSEINSQKKLDNSMEKMFKQFEEDWTPEFLTEEKITGEEENG
jgi:hypothetical protein